MATSYTSLHFMFVQSSMKLDYDENETDLESLEADSTDSTRHHSNDDDEVDDDDDDDDEQEKEKEAEGANDNSGEVRDRETNPAQQKRSTHAISRASVGSSRRHQPQQRQRQRQRQSGSQRPAGARTSLAEVSLRPTTDGGRSRPVNAGRRKGLRYRWRVKPGRPPGGRARSRPRPAATVLADDASAFHSDDDSGPTQPQTERKSCKELTCVKGRGICVNENEGARCRCHLGAVGSFCERGVCRPIPYLEPTIYTV